MTSFEKKDIINKKKTEDPLLKKKIDPLAKKKEDLLSGKKKDSSMKNKEDSSLNNKENSLLKKNEDHMKTSLIDDHYIWDDTDESPDDSKFDDYRQLYNYYGIREKGAIGLKNLKNTCFMNSSLQCLSHIQELYNKLKQYRKKGILTSHFYEMLYLMHETKNGSSFEPEDIFKEIYTRFPKYKKSNNRMQMNLLQIF